MSLLSTVTPIESRSLNSNLRNLPVDLSLGYFPDSSNPLTIPGSTNLGEAVIMSIAKNKLKNKLRDTRERFTSEGLKMNPTSTLIFLTATLTTIQAKQHHTSPGWFMGMLYLTKAMSTSRGVTSTESHLQANVSTSKPPQNYLPAAKDGQKYIKIDTLIDLFPDNQRLKAIREQWEEMLCLVQKHRPEDTRHAPLRNDIIPNLAVINCNKMAQFDSWKPVYHNQIIEFQTEATPHREKLLTITLTYSIITTLILITLVASRVLSKNRQATTSELEHMRENVKLTEHLPLESLYSGPGWDWPRTSWSQGKLDNRTTLVEVPNARDTLKISQTCDSITRGDKHNQSIQPQQEEHYKEPRHFGNIALALRGHSLRGPFLLRGPIHRTRFSTGPIHCTCIFNLKKKIYFLI